MLKAAPADIFGKHESLISRFFLRFLTLCLLKMKDKFCDDIITGSLIYFILTNKAMFLMNLRILSIFILVLLLEKVFN